MADRRHQSHAQKRDAGLESMESQPNLSGVDLAEAHLSHTNLMKATLIGAILRQANLGGAHLTRANLMQAILCGTILTAATLSGATVYGASLSWANLSRADLRQAGLSGADLTDVTLSQATLIQADLCGDNLRGADLSEADLSGADLRDANQLNESTGARRGETRRRKRRKAQALLRATIQIHRGFSCFFSSEKPFLCLLEPGHRDMPRWDRGYTLPYRAYLYSRMASMSGVYRK